METLKTRPVPSLLRYWWVLVVRGVLALAFGVIALLWPQITIAVLVTLFAVFALLDGVASVISAVRHRHFGWQFFGGLLSIAVAVLVVLWPISAWFALLLLIAAWAIVRGVFDVAAAVALRHELDSRYEWLLVLTGIVSILFGVFIVLWPLAGTLAVVTVVAAFAVFLGVLLIATGLRQRSLFHRGPGGAARQLT